MSDESLKKAKPKTRIVLSDQMLATLSSWRAQIETLHPEFHPSDRELIFWAVERNAVLSGKNIEEIKEKYFNKLDELEGLLKQLKLAQLKEDEGAVVDLLARVSLNRKPLARSPKNTPPPSGQPIELDSEGA